MKNGILMEMTIEDIREFKPEVVVMGIGSTEPHGPVLPYGTDYFQVDAVVRRAVIEANEQSARALMYPTLPIGNNVNFKAFPFACRMGVNTLMRVVLDIIGALEEDGIRKIVLINGHGGNTDAIRAALRAHVGARKPGEGAFVCMPSGSAPPGLIKHQSNHGGEAEVSRMLHIREDLVRKEEFDVFPFGELAVEELNDPGVYFVRPWHLHVPKAAGGDVRESTAEKGEQFIKHTAKQIAKLLVALSKTEWTPHFPFKG